MDVSMTVVVGIIVAGISIFLLALMFRRANEVDLTGKTDEKPEWMSTNPPQETITATKAEGEGVALFNHDEGEKLASAFVEQIEDIFREKLESHPKLKKYKVDIGTSSDLGLEYWVNGDKFSSLDTLPNEELKQVLSETIKDWESRK